MADQVKVFKSGTVTAAELTNSNELVLLQTGATTKAVVKDVLVTSAAPLLSDGTTSATVELYNDTIKLADLNTATGSEVIDTNSKLYYKLTPTPTVSGSFGYTTDSSKTILVNSTTDVYYTGVSPSLFKDAAVSNYGLASDATIIRTHFDSSFTNITTSGATTNTVPTMTLPAFYYPSQDGNTAYYYYWDGNSNTYLYKTTATDGITTASWSNFQNDVYAGWTFDLKNNVLAASPSSFIYMVNPETGVTTTKSMSSWPSGSSYSSNAACNNYFFSIRSSSYNTTLYFTPLNTTTTVGRRITFPTTFTVSTHTSFAACYNPTEDKYYFLVGTTNSNMKLFSATGAQLEGAVTNFTGVSLGAIQDLNIFPFVVDSNRFISGDSDGNFYLMSGGTNYKVYMNNNTATVVKSFVQSSYYISGWFEKTSAATSTATATLADIDLDITCKVSGVEITGV